MSLYPLPGKPVTPGNFCWSPPESIRRGLVQAIRLVASGEASVDQRVIQLIADRYPQHEDQCLGSLTKREQTVLKALLNGLTNKKIGRQVGVSESAIKATLQQLFDKAGVRTRSQLVRAALDGSLAPAGVAAPGRKRFPSMANRLGNPLIF